ncbi:MAG: DeoR/GlpR family DNA-binding transcription regulator [Spirochaetia bacterium]
MEKVNSLFAEERKELIVSLVEELGKVNVGELCERFDVSGATIRNDLRELEHRRLITRVHGGALRRSRVTEEVLIDNRSATPQPAKQAIARIAFEQVEDGDTIILDTGTTCHELSLLLKDRNDLTVITNDLSSALSLEVFPSVRVILVGGVLRRGYHCTVEPVVSPWDDLTADKVFLGANGFTLDKGAMTPDISQAAVKRGMIRAARKVILLCDSTKFGRSSLFRFAPLEKIDLMISDKIPPEIAWGLEAEGIDHLSRHDE